MQTPAELEAYLYRNIPISKAMGVRVASACKKEMALHAPIAPNINHKRTVFGGSLQAVATLACWTLLHANLRDQTDPAEIVISSSNIDYIRPVTGNFEVRATLPDQKRWQNFLKTFNKHGRARIQLTAHILEEENLAIDYTGSFAALRVCYAA
ncbi:MAG: YiiD C-terminal domain-containing protein [Alphaproteobacteria bacterium]|nr:YiiD C-terminal domain-containing protein [Alphaproteobacteria bacterium]